MARPRKSGILYFSHDADASESPKFCALRGHFGWEGEGRFWALNGMIARAEGCKLNLKRGFVKAAIAEKLSLSLSEFDAFIAFLSDLQECSLLHNDDGIIWTDRCAEEYEEVIRSREEDRSRKRRGKPTYPSGIQPENDDIRVDSEGKEGFSTEGGREGGKEGKEGRDNTLSGSETDPDAVSTLVQSQAAIQDRIPHAEIVAFLNLHAGTNFNSATDATRRFIRARWNEGFRLQDFKRVIQTKCAQWKRDPKMVGFLRPQTLFGAKFESYLNEASTTTASIPCEECGAVGSHHYDCSHSRTAEEERKERGLKKEPQEFIEGSSPAPPGEPPDDFVDDFPDEFPESAK